MTDSLKFGPEWLRNLAGDGCSTGGGGGGIGLTPQRYQLAEHRYGREEMLALFNRTYKPPEPLVSLTGLYVPSTQLPLALTEMTEDETRLWTGGVPTTIGRGRGGSVDRGGRGRSGRIVPHYTRGVGGFDDLGDTPRIESQPYPTRTRAFDRPPNDRVWSERNGVDTIEWNGSTSPRKELNRGASGSSLMESNWRRHRAGEEDDGWRMQERNARSQGEKWVKSSWRDAEKERGERVDIEDEKRGDRWDHKGNNRAFDPHPPPIRRGRLNHHEHDILPEWAVDSLNEGGGSFDASGAFHGVYSDDEDDLGGERARRRGSRSRRLSEGSAAVAAIAPGFARSQPPPGNFSAAPGMRVKQQHQQPPPVERPLNGERSKSLHEDKELRRSLSPISSPPASPNLSRRPAPTLELQQQAAPTTQQLQQSQKRDKNKTVEQNKTANSQTSATPNASTAKVKSKTDSSKKTEDSRQSKKATGKTEDIRKGADPDRGKTSAQQVSQKTSHQQQRQLATNMASSVIDQSDDKLKSEADNLDRMEEEVAKLIDGEKLPPAPGLLSSSVVGQKIHESASIVQSTTVVHEKWFYRDPQGEVQGPFLASEMAEWHKQGYFASNLLVRRTCDERYTTLGDLINLCGVVPFSPGTKFPPLKISDPLMSPNVPGLSPASLAASVGLSKPGMMEDPMLLYQYQQYRLLQNQQLLFKQLRATAIAKLSQSDHWQNLSPVEQNQLVLQYMHSIDPDIADMSQSQPPQVMPNSFMPTMSQNVPPPSNSVLQLFPQLQQTAKTQAESVGHVAPPSSHVVNSPQQLSGSTPIDPIQQLMQQMSGIRNLPPMPQATPPQPQPPPQEDNPIKSWLRQLGITNGHMQQQQQAPSQPQLDSVWHQPPPHLSTAFNAQSWMSQVGAIQPSIPPGQLSGSLWDVHPKEMKTEQQILEEQNLKIQEEKKKEESRMKEEIERQQAEHDRMKRQQEEEVARLKSEEAVKREEAERKKREEQKRQKEEEKRKQEEELRKVEEKKRKEEEKKREEKRKHDEEANRKKQEEEKRKRDELKRQEEKLRKEEEKRKKIEDEQRRQEEERLRKEEEARKKAEAEEQARKAEQRRREAEALRKLQERSKAPWAQAPPAPPPTAQASLAEIQRLEREKKAEEIRLQQLLQQQRLAQQKAAEAAQEALTDSAKRLQFKWAEKVAPVNTANQVKSLTQIQQEEQERITKVKQHERERLEKEKANQLKSAAEIDELLMSSQTYAGFWDDPAPKSNANTVAAKVANTVAKQTSKQQQAAAKAMSQQQQQQQQQNNKTAKSKNKKEEELVKKIFEQNTAKTDDFTQWCNKALIGLQVTVDIPTFIGFLRDIEAAYEVKEYIRMYLGDTKQSSEFAKQFLEKRSKWKSAQRPQTHADDLCKPAPAVNPNASTEFQEVKSKSKKPKKGKMYKVDSKMLGFSVMSAPDRINVGDRDYAEGV